MIAHDVAPDTARTQRASTAWNSLPTAQLDRLIDAALAEDIGFGDVTTAITVPPGTQASAVLIAKQTGVISGLRVAERVFRRHDPDVDFRLLASDGDSVELGQLVAEFSGGAAAMLEAERVALNLMQRMSGIATLTAEFVGRVAHTKARILDTRKTVPGLRMLDKYAVICGGGYNHRFGLSDGILIKDNHISAAGGIPAVLGRARAGRPHGLRIEIEVEDMAQLEQALDGHADVILLDNMAPDQLREAVSRVTGRALIEASGGVSLDTVAAIAETGVDFISVGLLTHSPPALDLSVEIRL